jgi:hypothetical protein
MKTRRTIKNLIRKEEFVVTGTDDELLQAEELLLKNGAKNYDPEHNDRNRCDGFKNAIRIFEDGDYSYLLKSVAKLGIKRKTSLPSPNFYNLPQNKSCNGVVVRRNPRLKLHEIVNANT